MFARNAWTDLNADVVYRIIYISGGSVPSTCLEKHSFKSVN